MSGIPWQPTGNLRPTLRLEDVGTRGKHLTDLLDVWNGGMNIILAKSEGARSDREKEVLLHLTFATELLKRHMTNVASDYHEEYYKNIIRALPRKAEEIKGT